MFLNTTFLSQEDRPYLVLLVETWLQSPLNVGGKIVTLNEVIKKRSEDALSFYNDLGYKVRSRISLTSLCTHSLSICRVPPLLLAASPRP